ncbi:MAG TPA: GAF domain-containing protein [Kineosporiaceae bacterium]|nr:GAF domain-containing protein [Kineosporiaceae bacterium]
MTTPWAAWPAGTDPEELYRRLAAARERFLATGHVGPSLRPVVAQSWRRCLESGIDPQAIRPEPDLTDADLGAYRADHPLAAVMPVVRRLLVEDAGETGLVVAVTDAEGRLLWVEGASRMRSRAEGMHFVEGARWSESVAGTNAPGTALALDHAVQIYGCEHLSDQVTPWSCAAAPIHDPQTGALLGALDLTGGDDVAAPQALTLVRAAAAAVEAELRLHRLGHGPQPGPEPYGGPEPHRPLRHRTPPPRPAARSGPWPATPLPALSVLGRDRGELRTSAGTVLLSPRHSELLLLLAQHPAGLTAEQLAVHLHEGDTALVTLRAELSRLRTLLAPLGEPVLASRPYRITGPLHTDVDLLRRLLDRGAYRRALTAYPGPVLPQSQSPAVQSLRLRLEHDLRACLLAGRDPELLWTFGQRSCAEDDIELWQTCLDRLPRGSHRRAIVAARLDRLHRELTAR